MRRRKYQSLIFHGDRICQQLGKRAISEWWEEQKQQRLPQIVQAVAVLEEEKRKFYHGKYEPKLDPQSGRFFPTNPVKGELLEGFQFGFLFENTCQKVCEFEEELEQEKSYE